MKTTIVRPWMLVLPFLPLNVDNLIHARPEACFPSFAKCPVSELLYNCMPSICSLTHRHLQISNYLIRNQSIGWIQMSSRTRDLMKIQARNYRYILYAWNITAICPNVVTLCDSEAELWTWWRKSQRIANYLVMWMSVHFLLINPSMEWPTISLDNSETVVHEMKGVGETPRQSNSCRELLVCMHNVAKAEQKTDIAIHWATLQEWRKVYKRQEAWIQRVSKLSSVLVITNPNPCKADEGKTIVNLIV